MEAPRMASTSPNSKLKLQCIPGWTVEIFAVIKALKHVGVVIQLTYLASAEARWILDFRE